MNENREVFILSRGRTTKVRLKNLPGLSQRGCEAAQQYGVQISACPYKTTAGDFLMMKCRCAARHPEAGGPANPRPAQTGNHTLRRKAS